MGKKYSSSLRIITSSLALMIALVGVCPGTAMAADAQYIGGTISALPAGTNGALDAQAIKVLKFTSSKGAFEIPFQGITSIEYGQKAGRRIGVAIAISPWILLSKKRKHFLTIGYKDGSEQAQAVVLELPKGTPRSVIAVLEARSGVKCEYESEEAKKHVHG